ncbi:MAG: DUF4160 domain-containing protein [Anaerolineaceae bacterium]|nr:DUF4160 domain-containing protein [Anaerolineaceae bacterium]
MPTVLYIRGWRLFFYANEDNEPPHIHARKGDVECKYWLHSDTFDIEEVYAYNASPANRREIRKIIFANFDYLLAEYENFQQQRGA